MASTTPKAVRETPISIHTPKASKLRRSIVLLAFVDAQYEVWCIDTIDHASFLG
jgi:hypothetical protein